MSREIIATEKAPAAIGPYSQAVKADGFIFCSGQIPINPVTQEFESGLVEAEARRVLENVKALLTAAGSSLAKVVKTTMFLVDMADFAKVNPIYAEYFPEHPPARSTIAVRELPKGAKIEIEVVAVA